MISTPSTAARPAVPPTSNLAAAAPEFQAGHAPGAAVDASAAPLPDSAGQLVSATDLLAWRRRLLQGGGSSADLDWLLDLAGGLAWSELQRLWLQPQVSVRLHHSLHALEAIWRAYRRGAGPLQYLVGRSPWRDLNLEVGPGVLIPRQETELLMELLLQAHRVERVEGAADMPLPRPAPALWADLGTGSGCLAIALARSFPASRGLAVDLSGTALAQCRRNLDAQGLGDRVVMLRGSWWEPLKPWWGQLELVVANPPYIPSAVVACLDPMVRDHEPRLALDGGDDGLDCLRTIIAAAPSALAPGGLLLVEHHHDQSRAVLELMAAAGLHHPVAHRDLEGVLRFAAAINPADIATDRAGAMCSGTAMGAGLEGLEPLLNGGQSRASSPGSPCNPPRQHSR